VRSKTDQLNLAHGTETKNKEETYLVAYLEAALKNCEILLIVAAKLINDSEL